MTIYQFDAINPNKIVALQPTDVINFTGGPALSASVFYNPNELDGSTILVEFGGHSATFDFGLVNVAANHNLHFADGSELLIGGLGGDPLQGSSVIVAMFGGDGADTLISRGGANVVQGNQGDDQIFTSDGSDTIFGGRGNDIIGTGLSLGGVEPGDFAQGNLGNDTIRGGDGADTLLGGQGDDSISGGESFFDFLNGNLGDDVIEAFGGGQVFGEAGNDTITAHGRDVVLSGGAGVDLFTFGVPVGPDTSQSIIVDWDPTEHLHFDGSLASSATNYVETTARDLINARDVARGLLNPGIIQTVAVQVGDSVVVFANAGSVILTGHALADIDFGNIV